MARTDVKPIDAQHGAQRTPHRVPDPTDAGCGMGLNHVRARPAWQAHRPRRRTGDPRDPAIAGGVPLTARRCSRAGRPRRFRNDSLITRFTRFLSTARRSTFLATTRPSRATPTSLGRAAPHSGPRRNRSCGSLSTASKSRLSNSRWPRPKRSAATSPAHDTPTTLATVGAEASDR